MLGMVPALVFNPPRSPRGGLQQNRLWHFGIRELSVRQNYSRTVQSCRTQKAVFEQRLQAKAAELIERAQYLQRLSEQR
jgi:hypothetical protein